VRLFNFSFVDILATTIGVLLFILLMAVVNQSGLLAHSRWTRAVARAKAGVAKAAEAEKEGKARYEAALERTKGAVAKIPPNAAAVAKRAQEIAEQNTRLAAESRAVRNEVRTLRAGKAAAEREIARLKKSESEGKRLKLPVAARKGNEVAVHVDCRRDGLVIIGSDPTKGAESRDRCPTRRIGDANSAFGRLLKRVREVRNSGQAREAVLVLWIRPDGIAAADAAIRAAEEANVPLGWEPAEKDWLF